jgi:hypothetical protein
MAASWADNQDGTGATITVTGAGVSDVTVPYTQYFPGGLGYAGTWVEHSAIIGNGSLALSLERGHYFGHTILSSGGVDTISPVEYFNVTETEESTHYQILEAVQSRIIAVNLDEVGANVLIRKIPSERGNDDSTYSYPVVMVSPMGTEQLRGGTNLRDDVGYPVLVSILARNNQDLTETNLNKFLLWRERLSAAFRGDQQLQLTSLQVHKTSVEAGPVLSPTAVWNNQFQCSLTIRSEARQTRGL